MDFSSESDVVVLILVECRALLFVEDFTFLFSIVGNEFMFSRS